jgi:hypothetical protein
MRPEDMGTARGNCGFLDVSTILSKLHTVVPPTLEA